MAINHEKAPTRSDLLYRDRYYNRITDNSKPNTMKIAPKTGYQYKVLKAFTDNGKTYEWGTLLTHSQYLRIGRKHWPHIQELKSPVIL